MKYIVLLQILYVISWKVFFVLIACEKICEEEQQIVRDELIVWPSTSTTTLSKPFCINENLEIISRSCLQGRWDHQPNCTFIQTEPPFCPDYLKHLVHNTTNLCYSLLPAGPFSQKCLHPLLYPVEQYQKILEKITTDFVWYPVRNEDAYDISEYTFVEPHENYGKPFETTIKYQVPLKGKRCIVHNYKEEYLAVNCNDSYPTLCVYYTYDNLCSKRHNAITCIYKTFDVDTSCICKEQKVETRRENFCPSNLEEFHYPYQNKLAQRLLFGDKCWTDLERSSEGYSWYNFGLSLNYTNWAENAKFSLKYVGMTAEGWNSFGNYDLDCVLCERKTAFNKSEYKLHLKYTKSSFQLEVRGYNNIKILETKSLNKVLCFFKSGDYIKHRISNFVKTDKDDLMMYEFKPENYGPGYYWCEAFLYPEMKLLKSEVIWLHDKNIYGNEYVIKVTTKYNNNTNPLDKLLYREFQKTLNKRFSSLNIVKSLRKFATLIVDEDNFNIQFLLHITIDASYKSDPSMENDLLFNTLNTAATLMNFTIDEFLSSNYCFQETIEIERTFLTWNATPAGNTAFSRELCLQTNDKLVQRTCQENFIFGARWNKIQGKCIRNASKSKITDELHDLLASNKPLDVILQNLTSLTDNYKDFEKVDIYLIGLILEKMTTNPSIDVEDVTTVVSNVMHSDRIVFAESQQIFRATDIILKNYDLILINSNTTFNTSHVLVETSNVIILMLNLEQTNKSGLALFKYNMSSRVEILDLNIDLQDLMEDENLQAGVFVHHNLITQIKEILNSSNNKRLIIELFKQDYLFNENSDRLYDMDKAFEVLIPEFQEKFSAPIFTFLKSKINDDFYGTCAHWQFWIEERKPERSYWNDSSVNITFDERNSIIGCEFWHVAHYGSLIARKKHLEDEINVDSLKIISLINSALSIFGSFMIFVTAVLFKSWRSTGNQVLLHFVFAITFKICLLYVSNSKKMIGKACIIAGSILHYFVVSEFCWMLVISILQFQRLVTVLGKQQKNILLKACAVGWITPLLPITIILSVDPHNYLMNEFGVCYPSGLALTLGVLVPTGLMLIGNLVIFIKITIDICCKNVPYSTGSNQDFIYRWRAVVLLFFMLGLPSLFAYLSYLDGGVIFLELFNCLTSMQGFVIFVYFIVLNESTRMLYVNFFKRKFGKNFYRSNS